jgi:hypothetical protein
MRAPNLAFVALAALTVPQLGLGCASNGRPGTAGGAAGVTGTANAGSVGSPGTAGSGGSSGSGAGTTGAGSAGASGGAGNAGSAAMTGASGGAGSGAAGTVAMASGGSGGFDQGQLFTDAAAVMPDPGTSTPDAATHTDAGTPPAPTATLHIGGFGLTAVFSQKGVDVTMVVNATNCAQGNHTLQLHGGFSCDNAGTEGPVWDGKRGDGIPQLTCGADKHGTLTYTRTGADLSMNWTVGDHSTKTDVTLHPGSVDTSCGTFF